jgi:hypothetical protein
MDASPNTNAIVFATVAADERRIAMICDLPSCTAPRELPIPAFGQPKWMPGGNAISFVPPQSSERSGNIWVQPLDGSSARQLTNFVDERPIVDYRWSRDGKRLAIARSSVTNDIVLFKGLKQ